MNRKMLNDIMWFLWSLCGLTAIPTVYFIVGTLKIKSYFIFILIMLFPVFFIFSVIATLKVISTRKGVKIDKNRLGNFFTRIIIESIVLSGCILVGRFIGELFFFEAESFFKNAYLHTVIITTISLPISLAEIHFLWKRCGNIGEKDILPSMTIGVLAGYLSFFIISTA